MLLFFRPENVDFNNESDLSSNGKNMATGKIERVTFLGNSADVVIRCGTIALRARVHPTRAPEAGNWFVFRSAGVVHYFSGVGNSLALRMQLKIPVEIMCRGCGTRLFLARSSPSRLCCNYEGTMLNDSEESRPIDKLQKARSFGFASG